MTPMNPERLRERRRAHERRQARLASSRLRRELDRLLDEGRDFSEYLQVAEPVDIPIEPTPKPSQWWRPPQTRFWKPKLL